MKKVSLILMSLAFLAVSCGPSKKSLVDLNNRMVSSQKKLLEDFNEFFSVVESGDHVKLRTQLAKWEKDTDEVIAEIKAKEDYKETKEFKDALMKLAQRQHDFVVHEAEDLVIFFEAISKISSEEDYDEAEFNRLYEAVTNFENEMDLLNKGFIKAQKEFAEKNNITLDFS